MENNNEIAYFKIHPAIGVAHLGTCDESVEFFNQLIEFQKACGKSDTEMKIYQSFKTEDKKQFKKQAVQFSVHAYDKNGNWLHKVDDNLIQWEIKLANRKLHNYSKKSQHKFYLPEISGTGNESKIIGKDPWTGKQEIDLGEFTNGKFIPPISKLYNREGLVKDNQLINGSIDQYPADASFDPVTKNDLKLSYTDNTSDGIISAKIKVEGANNKIYSIEAEPAWLVVAPPKTNVFFTPAEAEIIKNTGRNFFPLENTNYNLDFIKKTSELLDIKSALDYKDCNCDSCKKSNIKDKINKNRSHDVFKHHPLKSKFFCKNNPHHLDYFMMNTINGDYDPGMEICLSGDPERNEVDFDIQQAFMKPGVRNIHPNEIRVKPFDEQAKLGTKPGQLTSGLCSTWQGDLIACLNFWTAENPLMAYENEERVEHEKFVVHHLENLDSVPDDERPVNKKLEDLQPDEKDIIDKYLKENRFNYAEEIVKSIGKRSLVYHEYDTEGNVYFIKVPKAEAKPKPKQN